VTALEWSAAVGVPYLAGLLCTHRYVIRDMRRHGELDDTGRRVALLAGVVWPYVLLVVALEAACRGAWAALRWPARWLAR